MNNPRERLTMTLGTPTQKSTISALVLSLIKSEYQVVEARGCMEVCFEAQVNVASDELPEWEVMKKECFEVGFRATRASRASEKWYLYASLVMNIEDPDLRRLRQNRFDKLLNQDTQNHDFYARVVRDSCKEMSE